MRPTQFKKKECARRRWRERQSAGNKDCGQVAAGGGGVLFMAIRVQLSTIICYGSRTGAADLRAPRERGTSRRLL